MDKKRFDEITERLLEINKSIVKLDPAIRSSAFELLKGYVTGIPSQPPHDGDTKHENHGGEVALEALISAHPQNEPSENVNLLAAYWYGKYGVAPFTLDNIRTAADEGGLTVPGRIDMTLKQAKDDGKKLYQSAGRGLFKPTVPGELYLKKTFNVRKGSGTPPTVGKK
jgi:hypothetical protein